MRDTKIPIQTRHSSAGIMLSAVLALLIAAASVMGFVVWSTSNIDNRALAQQTEVAAKVLSARRDSLLKEQQSIAMRDDTLLHTRFDFDPVWVEQQLGTCMFAFFGHDGSILLGPDNKRLYTMAGGQGVPADRRTAIPPAVASMVGKLRGEIATGGLTPYNTGQSDTPLQLSDIAIIDGQPTLVSVIPIVSDTRTIPQQLGTELIFVSLVSLNISQPNSWTMNGTLFENASFTGIDGHDPDKSAFPLINAAGRLQGFFEWTPERPGAHLLVQTAPVLAGGFSIAAVLVFYLLYRLRRSTNELDAQRLIAMHQANFDRLTGLPNRTKFDTESRGCTDASRRRRGTGSAHDARSRSVQAGQ
ncbi:CHASE4 domain-containing protein [Devosia algicola]|uniref:CHASE4 domain-containing protein n=1 Tax=Devosia algicola TaxID=3026418 RepID=A0ABY7YSK9_9HYPH|nr:CHASE4 domain-containing protein [Devosia algicola]WDR04108.1 CHASE4 domain-containing protein [Devosia algicola]